MSRRMGNVLLAAAVTALGLPLVAWAWESYARWETGYDEPVPLDERTDVLQYVPAVFARHLFAARRVDARSWGPNGTWPINARGYRGPDVDERPAEGTIRIIVYGGSSVFDPVAGHLDDWPHRVERRLAEGRSVEVINAGIPGHGSADAVGRLFAEGHRFAPDLVLFYEGWNDVKDLSDDRSLLRRRQPWKPEADPRRTPTGPVDRWFLARSVAYGRLRDRFMAWRLGDGEVAPRKGIELGHSLSESALAQFRMSVATFIDVARNAGARPVLVHQATLVTADASDAARALIRYDYVGLSHDAVAEAFRRLDAIIDEVAASDGVPVIDPRPAMNGRLEYFRDHVHLTLDGSDRLAAIVAAGLEPLLASAVPPPAPATP